MCDNCTTIVRVRATDFEFVRVRVREKFFVREHLYLDTIFYRSNFRSAQISVQEKVLFFSDLNTIYRSKTLLIYIFSFRIYPNDTSTRSISCHFYDFFFFNFKI